MSLNLARILISVVAVLLLVGCGMDDEDAATNGGSGAEVSDTPAASVAEEELTEGDVDPTEITLDAVDDSGVHGSVTVGPADADAISLDLELASGGEQTRALEAAKGSCSDAVDPGAIDAALESVSTFTLPDIEDGVLRHEVELPDEVVGEGLYALIVYEDADVGGTIVACAAIEVT